MIGYLLPILLFLVSPSTFLYFNPFTPIICQSLLNKKSAFFSALCGGLVRDLFLASPKFGLCGLSSVLTAHLLSWTASFITFEGTVGLIESAALFSAVDFMLSSFFCGLVLSSIPWNLFFLYVVFSVFWTLIFSLRLPHFKKRRI